MSTSVNSTHTSVPASSRAPTIPATHTAESAYTNGHHHHHHHDAGAQSGSANMGKKGKQKKATDPTEASNLIAAKISQLESDAAGDKEQEAEIGWLRHLIYCVCAVLFDIAGHTRGSIRSHSAWQAMLCLLSHIMNYEHPPGDSFLNELRFDSPYATFVRSSS